jgi:hypothetical protein
VVREAKSAGRERITIRRLGARIFRETKGRDAATAPARSEDTCVTFFAVTLPYAPRTAALSSVVVASLLWGCASLLGDFSPGEAGTGGGEGGPDVGSVPVADAGSGGDVGTGPGVDAAEDGPATGQDASGAPDASSGNDGGDAGVDQAAPWTPAALDQAGELALWLEASSANLVISGGLVESWKDLSKNKNDASNPNGGPTVLPSAINGHDAVNFASFGVTLAMADAASLQFAMDQIYITAVAKVTKGSPYFFAKYATGVSGAGVYYSAGLLFLATAGVSDAGASIIGPVAEVSALSGNELDWDAPCFEDGNFHIVAMRRTSSSTLELTVDDQTPVTTETGDFDVSEPGQSAYLGSVSFGSVHPATNFDIVELLAVHSASSGVVADSDVANVHAYLKQKYGL